MLKKFIQRYLPEPNEIKNNRSLQFLHHHLRDANLWYLNRRSVAKAFLVGVFAAFIPIPFQMLFAGTLAIFLRCNLPISVSLVWITNPLTMPVLFYFTYKIGCFLLNIPDAHTQFEFSWEWIMSELSRIWLPLYFGSFVFAIFAAIMSYIIVHVIWRLSIIRHWKNRRKTKIIRDKS